MNTFLKYLDFILDRLIWVWHYLMNPIEDVGDTVRLTTKNLEAILKRAGISELLPYKYYSEYAGDVGVYTGDGEYDKKGNYKGDRHGIIFKVSGAAFPNTEMQKVINNFIAVANKKNVVVNIFSMASQNIEHQIVEFEKYHHCNVDIDNLPFLKRIIAERANTLRKWARSSMFGSTGADFRLKEFVTVVSVLYPEDTLIGDIVSDAGKFKANLSSFGAKNFSASELVTLLREFFHNGRGQQAWNRNEDNSMRINKQVTAGGVKVTTETGSKNTNILINESTKVSVLTTDKFPNSLDFSEFNSLFYDRTEIKGPPPITVPFFVSLTLVYEDQEKTRKEAKEKLQHNIGQLAGIPQKKMRKNPHLKKQLSETKTALDMIDEGEMILPGMFSIVLFDEDESAVKRSRDYIISKFREKEWILVQETFNYVALMEIIFSLPLQFRDEAKKFLGRFNILYRNNHSAIAPLIGDSKGYLKNYHMPLFSSTGQLQWFDPYDSPTNYSIACAGDSGSGKSYTFADFLVLNTAAGYFTCLIDSLPSYQRAVTMLGGQYEDFSGDDLCANFFTDMLEARNEDESILYEDLGEGNLCPVIDEDEMNTLIPVVALMAGIDLSDMTSKQIDTGIDNAFLRQEIKQAITNAWRRKRNDAGMQDVNEELQARQAEEASLEHSEAALQIYKMCKALDDYADPTSSSYKLFNGVNNINIKKDLAGFELTRLEGKGKFYQIFLMLLANKIVNKFFDPKVKHRPKCLIVDEFWRYKDLPIVLKFMEELVRKARKASGFIVPITQGIEDYYASPGMKAIADSCAFRWILQQDPNKLSTADKAGYLPFTDFTKKQMEKIRNSPPHYGEFAVFNGSKQVFSRLRVDRTSHWLYTTHEGDLKKLRALQEQYDINETEACLLAAFREDFPTKTIEDGLEHIKDLTNDSWEKLRMNEQERKETILDLLYQTVQGKQDNIDFNEEHVFFSLEKEMLYITPYLKHGVEDKIEVEEYRKILKEAGLSSKFKEVAIARVHALYALANKTIVYDSSLDSFLDRSYVQRTIELIQETELPVILAVDFAEIDAKEVPIALEMLDKLKENNIQVLSKVSSSLSLDLLLEDKSSFKMVSLEEYRENIALENIVYQILDKGIKVIFNGVDKKEDITWVKEQDRGAYYIKSKEYALIKERKVYV